MPGTVSRSFTKKFYILSSLWIIAASAAGIFIYDQMSRKDVNDHLAPLAKLRVCGDQGSVTEKNLETLAAQWLVNTAKVSQDVQRSLLQNIMALPTLARKILQQNQIRFTINSGQSPFTCAASGSSIPNLELSCVKATIKNGLFIVLGQSNYISPQGEPLNMAQSDQLHTEVLPIGFWILFRGLWHADISKPVIKDDEISVGNRLLMIRKYVISAFKFSQGEQDFYHKAFSPSGRESPTFLSRTLLLTASNIYCSKSSYENLLAQQPEATKRFFWAYGCNLGKPWFMTDKDFVDLCPNTTASK